MKFDRRSFLHLTVSAIALPAMGGFAWAQPYPIRPVRIISGFPAGSAADILARLVGQPLSQRIAQPVITEDRPGAGGNLATGIVVRSPPDGYTLLMAAVVNAINVTLYPNMNFNFLRDIAPVASIGSGDYVMVVNPSVPVKTVPEFIAYAKANPGKVNMASPGNGTFPHVLGELFKMMTGVDLVHVPYRTSYMPRFARRTGACRVSANAVCDRTNQSRQIARPCSDWRKALGCPARCADRARFRAEL